MRCWSWWRFFFFLHSVNRHCTLHIDSRVFHSPAVTLAVKTIRVWLWSVLTYELFISGEDDCKLSA